MNDSLIEVGKIVNTHGVRGELKVQPWCDSAEQFCEIGVLYLDGAPLEIAARRVHKGSVLLTLPGVTDLDGALPYKEKILSARRRDIPLPEGRYLNADLIGLTVLDAESGDAVGTIRDVLLYPANSVLVVRGAREYMIPAVSAFIEKTDLDAGTMTVHLLKGMASDEN